MRMAKNRNVYTEINSITNIETGEICKREQIQIYKTEGEGNYVKMYLEDISKLYDIPQGARTLLLKLVEIMDYDGNIYLNKAVKDKICAEIGILDQTFRSYLLKITKSKIMKFLGGGHYIINPNLFAKGDAKHVLGLRKNYTLIINYTKDGKRKIKGEIS